MKLTLPQLVALAARHGFPDPELAAAIAMAESGDRTGLANTDAVNDTSAQTVFPSGIGPERSVGLWQINVKANPSFAQWNLTDPDVNAQAAFQLSSKGTHWMGWSTYKCCLQTCPHIPCNENLRRVIAARSASSNDFSRVRPPVSPPSGATAVFGVALLAVIAAVAADEARARFA
jgi:hypothetical protein